MRSLICAIASIALIGCGSLASLTRNETVPAGTSLEVRFVDGLSSEASRAGQSFDTKVDGDVVIDGRTVIPAGSTVTGHVTEAHGPRKIGGRAELSVDFDSLELPSGASVSIEAGFSRSGKSETPKDVAIIGGSTLGGAILGHQVDGEKGSTIGAILGGLVGTAAAVQTRGKPVEIPPGTVMTLRLTEPVTVPVRTS